MSRTTMFTTELTFAYFIGYSGPDQVLPPKLALKQNGDVSMDLIAKEMTRAFQVSIISSSCCFLFLTSDAFPFQILPKLFFKRRGMPTLN